MPLRGRAKGDNESQVKDQTPHSSAHVGLPGWFRRSKLVRTSAARQRGPIRHRRKAAGDPAGRAVGWQVSSSDPHEYHPPCRTRSIERRDRHRMSRSVTKATA